MQQRLRGSGEAISHVRAYIQSIDELSNTIYESKSVGLASSIIEGVGVKFLKFIKPLKLEDDFVTSSNFFNHESRH
jgi:hypothetical protein